MRDLRGEARAIERAFGIEDSVAANTLATLGDLVSYDADQRILECGAHADLLSVILSGEVDLCLPVNLLPRDKGVKIERVGVGGILGWSAIVSPFSYVLSAWAVGPVETLAFAPEVIREWCDANLKSGLQLQRQVANAIGGRLASMIGALRGEIEHSIDQKRRGGYE